MPSRNRDALLAARITALEEGGGGGGLALTQEQIDDFGEMLPAVTLAGAATAEVEPGGISLTLGAATPCPVLPFSCTVVLDVDAFGMLQVNVNFAAVPSGTRVVFTGCTAKGSGAIPLATDFVYAGGVPGGNSDALADILANGQTIYTFMGLLVPIEPGE